MRCHLVVGVIERDGGTLYCTALIIGDEGTLLAKHRKLMPTASERLVWGMGDGSHLSVVDTSVGKIDRLSADGHSKSKNERGFTTRTPLCSVISKRSGSPLTTNDPRPSIAAATYLSSSGSLLTAPIS